MLTPKELYHEGLEVVVPIETLELEETVAQNEMSPNLDQGLVELRASTPALNSIGTRSGEIELQLEEQPGLELAPINSQESVLLNCILDDSIHYESHIQPTPPPIISFDSYEMEAIVSTKESDKLALQLLKSIEPQQETVPSSPKSKRRSSILSGFRKKQPKLEKTDPQPSSALGSGGFSSATLTAALTKAAVEGNLCVVASLLNMGANVNFVFENIEEPPNGMDRIYARLGRQNTIEQSTKREYHNIMSNVVTQNSAPAPTIRYLIAMGADGVSIDMALTAAILADNLPLALSLVPRADVYSLRNYRLDGVSYSCGSSIAHAALASSVPRSTRKTVLEYILQKKDFDMSKTVYTSRTTHDTLSLLIMTLDWELINQIPYEANSNAAFLENGMSKIITREEWAKHPELALLTLRALHSRFLNHVISYGSTFLAEAVIGGSLPGTIFLLNLNVDHETILADPKNKSLTLNSSGKELKHLSILSCAATAGHLDICRVLVKAGASPWKLSPNGLTPFLEACRGDALAVAQYFLSLNPSKDVLGTFILCVDKTSSTNLKF
jgi:hypothetical protein